MKKFKIILLENNTLTEHEVESWSADLLGLTGDLNQQGIYFNLGALVSITRIA